MLEGLLCKVSRKSGDGSPAITHPEAQSSSRTGVPVAPPPFYFVSVKSASLTSCRLVVSKRQRRPKPGASPEYLQAALIDARHVQAYHCERQ